MKMIASRKRRRQKKQKQDGDEMKKIVKLNRQKRIKIVYHDLLNTTPDRRDVLLFL